MRHRGDDVWMVTFSFSKELYKRCKLSGGRYSRTHRGWWWRQEEWSRERLLDELTNSDEENKKSDKNNKVYSLNLIPSEVMAKIVEMRNWMQQKRYSSSTVETYISFVKQFFSSR